MKTKPTIKKNTVNLFRNNPSLPPPGGRKGGLSFPPLWGPAGLFLFFLFWGSGGLFAQSDWQWGIRGGSSTNEFNGDAFEETVVDMATDPNGNVYIISTVGGNNLDVQGQTYIFHHTYGFAGPADDDHAGLIVSYDCDGNYRWGKLISGTNDFVFEVETDTLGNVYVTGEVFPGQKDPFFGDLYEVHFGTDTIIPYSPNPKKYKKAHFLARYDTLGNFEQLIMPQADSITFPESSNYAYAPLDLVADPDGTQHWFWHLRDVDLSGNPYTPSFEGDTLPKGHYVFRYDAQGNYLGETKLEMHTVDDNTGLWTIWINHDPVSGSYYLSGYNELYHLSQTTSLNCSLHIGGQLVDSPIFVAKFDSLGQSVWMIKGGSNISPNNQFHGRPQICNQGYIFLSGTLCGDPVITFNGYTAQNNLSPIGRNFPVLIKMDAQGNLLWGTHADCQGGSAVFCHVALNGDQASFTGSFSDLQWGNVYYPGVANSGVDIYLASFDTDTGNFISLDSIGSDFGYNEYPTAIASGPRGNVYVGGEFSSQMYVAGNTLQNVHGTFGTDFFVAKFGQNNCNCTLPEAKFTFSGTSNGTVNFTYTGSFGYNELEWGFGNGIALTTTTGNTSQTYTNPGEYWVCVTAYNNCGYDSWCTMVEPFNLGTGQLSKNTFQVYPNPFQNQLQIGATEPLSYRLFSISGKELRSGEVKKGRNTLLLGDLPSGFYMLVLENERGQQRTVKVVKE